MQRREFLGGSTIAAILASLPGDILASDIAADLTDLSASQLSCAIRQRHVSCVEVMQSYLQRIHRYNPVYNAIVSLLDDAVACYAVPGITVNLFLQGSDTRQVTPLTQPSKGLTDGNTQFRQARRTY